MASYECKSCGSYSQEEGSCIVCGNPLGDLARAIRAAGESSLIMAMIWVAASFLLRMQLPLFALIFGGIVSLYTTRRSAGRGFLFQLIATGFTILGIVLADSMAMLLEVARESSFSASDITIDMLLADMKYRILNDPVTGLFFVLGIMGGYWIWK